MDIINVWQRIVSSPNHVCMTVMIYSYVFMFSMFDVLVYLHAAHYCSIFVG